MSKHDASTDPMTSVFDNNDHLLKIWVEERRRADFHASLMWENVKYFSTLLSILVTADVFIVKLWFEPKADPGIVFISSLILPVFIVATSILGEKELGRRWKRVLECLAISAKLEGLLGLCSDISDRLTEFKEDRFLYPRWIESRRKYQSSASFIKGEMKGYNMFTHMRKVYFITTVIGLFLIALPIGVFIAPTSNNAEQFTVMMRIGSVDSRWLSVEQNGVTAVFLKDNASVGMYQLMLSSIQNITMAKGGYTVMIYEGKSGLYITQFEIYVAKDVEIEVYVR